MITYYLSSGVKTQQVLELSDSSGSDSGSGSGGIPVMESPPSPSIQMWWFEQGNTRASRKQVSSSSSSSSSK